MYLKLLNECRNRVLQSCLQKWYNGFKIQGKQVVRKNKVLDIQAGLPCWCIGTIYCEFKNKPNVLHEISNDTYDAMEAVATYIQPEGPNDIMLEDESGRILLVGKLIKSLTFVTGTVLGFLGMEAEAGTFQVLDICYPVPLPQAPLHPVEGKKLVFLSGLNLTSRYSDFPLKVNLLQHLLSGDIGNSERFKQVCRLIVCGNSVRQSDDKNELYKSLKILDDFLTNVLKSLPVILLPGEHDPTECSIPQQPLNKVLFSENLKPYFSEINKDFFKLVTNPYWLDCEGIQILVTSGQIIDDMCKYVFPNNANCNNIDDTIENRLDLIEATLNWQNIAPNAPDTLWCFPFTDNNPFILNEFPHVYVVGNQPGYGTRRVRISDHKEVLLVALPAFSETGALVSLDLNDLKVELLTID